MSTARTTRRILAVSAAGTAAALFAAPAAVAAPINSPKTETFTVTCPGGDVAIVTPPGNGTFTPGFIVGTHQLLIPYRFTFTVTIGGQTFTETEAKKAPLPADNITCTFSETFTENGQTGTFTGTVMAVVGGRGKAHSGWNAVLAPVVTGGGGRVGL